MLKECWAVFIFLILMYVVVTVFIGCATVREIPVDGFKMQVNTVCSVTSDKMKIGVFGIPLFTYTYNVKQYKFPYDPKKNSKRCSGILW